MKPKLALFAVTIVAGLFLFPGCAKKQGCTDMQALNYDATAEKDDGSCIARVYGCMDTASVNYNPLANTENGTCTYGVSGCMDSHSDNYNPQATVDDGSCIPSRDKFIGSYTCSEVCGPDNYTYTMVVTASSANSYSIILYNIGDFSPSMNAEATVNGSNVTLVSATYNGIAITGSGTLTGVVLTINYTATEVSSGNSITCTVTANKQ
jgi:hypothetical protein